jgi:hypothetical protein
MRLVEGARLLSNVRRGFVLNCCGCLALAIYYPVDTAISIVSESPPNPVSGIGFPDLSLMMSGAPQASPGPIASPGVSLSFQKSVPN